MTSPDHPSPDGPARLWADLERPPLRAAPLRRALVHDGGWARLDVLARTGSTNADLADRATGPDAAAWPHGSVLVTDDQTGGRGRLGRTWTAPPRAALAVSVLLRPTADAAGLPWLGVLAGAAVVDACAALGVAARLKWPNDVLVDGPDAPGKVCGVLAEVRPGADGPVVVVGTGINVAQRVGELPVTAPPAAPATSLALAGASSADLDTVLRRYLRALRTRLDATALPGGGVDGAAARELALAVSATVGTDVRAHLPGGEVLEGRAVDLDEDGRLVVQGSGGARTSLAAGDVVHLRPGG